MTVIGRFKETYNNQEYPSIMDAVGKLDPSIKSTVVAHLKRGKTLSLAAGYATDVISGELINTPYACCSDGVYGWRSDVLYYVEHYDIALPEEFIQFVQNQH